MKIKGLFGRAMAVLLTCTMLMPAALNAAAFSDTAGHWAEAQIEYMVQKSVAKGYPDGTFLPGNQVTRAEFITMIDETFGLVGTQGLSYSDVKSTDWYYPYIAKAAKQGYLLDYGKKINPNEQIYREEAAALIARYLDLPEDEAVSKTKFSDYNQIDADYRDYVLRTAYAGLINGYPDGTFGPKNTLTRAEALAILGRAAGTIFDASAQGLDSSATGDNAIVKKSGVNIRKAEIDGDMIITEGASSGTVTLSQCIIDGTLTIRGNAKIVLSECEIDEIIFDTGLKTPSSLTVEDETTIGEITLVSPAGIDAKSGTEIDELTVTSNATASSVTGAPDLGKLTINAARFSSSVVPDEYEIADGLSATFNGVSTSGGEDDNVGFTKTPELKVKSGYDYLSYTTSANGYVYYYYTNTATAPSADEFKKQYSATESLKGRFSVKKGEAEEEKAKPTASTSGYSYVAVCFADASEKYYKPVVIKRAETTSGYGFSGTPTISTVGGYDQLNAVPLNSGKLYYYYTSTSTAPSASQFMNVYATATNKSMLNTTANVTIAQNIAYSANVATYNYVVLMAVDSKGNSLTPLILKRGSTGIEATSSGFYSAPYITENMGYDYITLNATTTGTVFYYYSATPTAPDTTTFQTTYNSNSISTYYKGTISVTTAMQNVSKQHPTARPPQATYPYIVFMLQGTNGTYYTPYVATRGATNNSAATGFSVAPTVVSAASGDTIAFTSSVTGQLMLYYTNDSVTPTPAQFTTNYSSYMTNATIPSTSANVTAGQSFSNVFQNTAVANYNYVVFMLTASGTTYQPVVVRRSTTGTSITNSGFLTTPVVTTSSTGFDSITVSAATMGTVLYYYTNYALSIPTDANSFNTQYAMSLYKGTGYVQTPYTSTTFSATTASSLLSSTGYNYVVMMFTPYSAIPGMTTTTTTTPIVVYRSNTTNSGSTSTNGNTYGFSVNPTSQYSSGSDYMTFTSAKDGELYYYYSDTDESNMNHVQFWAEYYERQSSDLAGTLNVTAGRDTGRNLISISQSNSNKYKYLVVMLVDGGTTYKPYSFLRK